MISNSPSHLAAAWALSLAIALPATADAAQSSPLGVWLDHTGRGAVEISPCGAALCGRVVWVKSATDAKGCGRQIIGDAKPVGKRGAHNGWIYSPEDRRRYNVEFTPLSDGRLKVVGYAGMKLFSRTMIWKRPAAGLVRCDAPQTTAARPASPPTPAPPKAAAKSESSIGGAEAVSSHDEDAASAPPKPNPNREAAGRKAAQDATLAAPDVAEVSDKDRDIAQEDVTDAPESGSQDNDGNGGEEPGARLADILDNVVKRSANGDCKLDLPWVKVRFRCED